MCRNIRPLFNFEPHAAAEELLDASLQYVRKISGMRAPSKANEQVFQRAVQWGLILVVLLEIQLAFALRLDTSQLMD